MLQFFLCFYCVTIFFINYWCYNLLMTNWNLSNNFFHKLSNSPHTMKYLPLVWWLSYWPYRNHVLWNCRSSWLALTLLTTSLLLAHPVKKKSIKRTYNAGITFKIICDTVFKSGLSKFCGRQPFKGYPLSRPYPLNFFKGCLPQNLISPLSNTLSHMLLSFY